MSRKAIVYIRQSTVAQVVRNVGSTDAQRGQRRFAEAWGWSSNLIEVIDDLGYSGTASAHRPGYQRLLKEIADGHVGAIFASDDSRLGRDTLDRLEFANLCISQQVLLVLDGRVGDLTDSTALLQNQLSAVLSHHENLRRREHLRRGAEARLAAGRSLTSPPAGYVLVEKGKWAKDPDPAVCEALEILFHTFPRERSYYATVRTLRRMGVKLPRRPRGKALRFVDPTVGNLSVILKTRTYTGDYYYRQSVALPSLGRRRDGQARRRRAFPEEMIVIKNHHPAFLTQNEWNEIQAVLAANAPSRTRRSAGSGNALLQGIVRCSRHGLAMTTSYGPVRGDRRPSYYTCEGNVAAGGAKCTTVPGQRLDRAVIARVLERLAPPRVAILCQSMREQRRDVRGAIRLHKIQLRELERRAEELETHLLNTDPNNRLVAATLERRLEAALKELATANTGIPTIGRIAHLEDTDLRELELLAADVPALFHAATTSHSDRKQLIRTVVEHVVVTENSQELTIASIVWTDGEASESISTTGEKHARRQMAEWKSAGMSIKDICRELNEKGCLTRWGNPWTPRVVAGVLRRQVRGHPKHETWQ